MPQAKTRPTPAGASDYIAAIEDPHRRADCEQLLQLMSAASGQPAVMWGTAIVGFGLHRYPLAGGKTGEICAVGFSSRKGDISIYGIDAAQQPALMARLGRHKLGKGCLYVARLADVDVEVLAQLVGAAAQAKQA